MFKKLDKMVLLPRQWALVSYLEAGYTITFNPQHIDTLAEELEGDIVEGEEDYARDLERWLECLELDDIGRSESLQPYLW